MEFLKNATIFDKVILINCFFYTQVLFSNIERIYEGIGDKFGLLIRNGVHYVIGLIVAFVWSWQMVPTLSLVSFLNIKFRLHLFVFFLQLLLRLCPSRHELVF